MLTNCEALRPTGVRRLRQERAMKSKMLPNLAQIAVIAALGAVQLQQALPVLAKLARRTAAPLERIVLLGSNPSYPGSAVPAAHPFVPPVEVCHRATVAAPVHLRATVLHVQAPRVEVETVVDRIPSRLVVPRRVRLPDAHGIAEMVQVQMNQADLQRELARAQREIDRAVARAQREQAF
jgi:hypothetical protein